MGLEIMEKMMKKFKIRKFLGQAGACLAAAAVLFLCLGSGKAMATPATPSEFVFDMEAEVMPGGDGSTYDVRVTVGNGGADWEGTVRLTVENRYFQSCAYDTELSLPAGSTKQFTVRIPVDSLEERRSSVYLSLLDRNGREVANQGYKGLLADKADALLMGILSDDYTALTYLDAGGQELYYYSDNYPLKLVELNQDNLAENLESLTFLVIDRYSTEVLADEQLEGIRGWNENGGILLLGTGTYAGDTLGGIGGYAGVESLAVYPPGEYRPSVGGNGTGGAMGNPANNGIGSNVDMDKLALAALKTVQPDFNVAYYSGGYVRSAGDGVVGVVPYSLAELGALDADAFDVQGRQYCVFALLDEISSYSRIRYSTNTGYYDVDYQRNRLFGILSNNGAALNFGILRVIVVLYVIFVGPVLYLILKLLKKRELYWAAVPVSALLGIVLVYAAGRGFEVKDTRVFSVSVEGLSGTGMKKTYLECYDAGHSEWQLKLSGDYEYAGPLDVSYYYGNDLYRQRIRKDGGDLYFGVNPTSSFENSTFIAGGKNTGARGSVRLQDIEGNNRQELAGTVANDTETDFRCFVMIVDEVMFVYGGLPAGESRKLEDLPLIYSGPPNYEDYGDYVSALRSFYDRDRYSKEELDALAALGIGICGMAKEAVGADVFFMGVTDNYERAVDDVCSETSYGCLYAVQ